ncbi:MAG: glycosyltransferase family 4 protein [Bacteroidia bacterium]|nr:glycosyltransferase family 4 protein [Bacteroidia bacterium]
MKLLHVSTPSGWRGGEQQAAYLAEALMEAGLEQIVLCPEGSALSARMQKAGLKVQHFRRRGLLGLALAARIAGICRKEGISLVHTHDSHAHSAAVLSCALFGNTTPLIVSRRVDFAVSDHAFSRWKYNHPSVKRILCVSDTIRRITAPALRDDSVLAVVHSGIDLSRYDPPVRRRKLQAELGLGPGVKLIGNLSALASHKDYPTFLRTAKALLKEGPDFHFIIAGSGPEEASIRQEIADMELQERVHLLGFREDVVEVMQSLYLFLITSVTEGLGTIILEAFAAGVPVVATRAGGIPELVEDGVTGLLADPGDYEGLKQAVLRIFADASLNDKMVQQARLRAADFSFRRTAEKTLQIYREVLRQ